MIPVEREPDATVADDLESCAWCGRITLTWTALPDRKPGEQVALCGACASQLAPVDVPSKAEWFALREAVRA